jgi:hypothetical protein
MAEDYGNGTSMVFGESEKPSGEEVSFSLQSTALLNGAKDRPTKFGYKFQFLPIVPKINPKLLKRVSLGMGTAILSPRCYHKFFLH